MPIHTRRHTCIHRYIDTYTVTYMTHDIRYTHDIHRIHYTRYILYLSTKTHKYIYTSIRTCMLTYLHAHIKALAALRILLLVPESICDVVQHRLKYSQTVHVQTKACMHAYKHTCTDARVHACIEVCMLICAQSCHPMLTSSLHPRLPLRLVLTFAVAVRLLMLLLVHQHQQQHHCHHHHNHHDQYD